MMRALVYSPSGEQISTLAGLQEWLQELLSLAMVRWGAREAVRIALLLVAEWCARRAAEYAKGTGAQSASAAAQVRSWQAAVERCRSEIV